MPRAPMVFPDSPLVYPREFIFKTFESDHGEV